MINKGKNCSVKKCTNLARCKGLCNKHYKRLLIHGDVNYTKTYTILTEKRCSKCRVIKPVEEFYAKTNKSVRSKCKTCYAEQTRINKLMKDYSLTPEQFQELLDRQNSLCGICHKVQVYGSSSRNLAVDHCHETGRVRGLLCNNCNRGLGLLGDTIEDIEKVIRYLNAVL